MSELKDNAPDSVIPLSLIDALKEAFEVQAASPVEVVKVASVVPGASYPVDIVAAIGMNSGKISGTLALCFPAKCFLGVLNQMLGENPVAVSEENADAAGELLNIIYASARVRINRAGHDFAPALPTVTHGTNVQISHGSATRVVRVDCRCDYGDFHLEVSLRRTAEKH